APAAAPAAAPAPALSPTELDHLFNGRVTLEYGSQPEPSYHTLEGLTPALPEDDAKTGWQQLLANDFKSARASFAKVLAATPGQPSAVHGMMLLDSLEGQGSQVLDMILAEVRHTAASPQALVAMNLLGSRDDLPLDASTRIAQLELDLVNDPQTDGGVRTILANALLNDPRDNSLLSGAKADKLLPLTGLVTGYQAVFGPFGLYDNDFSGGDMQRNLLMRPFPPENGLGNLQFTDPVPTPPPAIAPLAAGWPRVVILNPDCIYGQLDVHDRLPSYDRPAIFYTLTNLHCDQPTDAVVMLTGLAQAVVYLNGEPIYTPDLAASYDRNLYMLGGRSLLKVHLVAGNNPILVKHDAQDADFSIRVTGADFQPIAGLVYKPLTPAELAAVKVTPLRGTVASEPVLSYDLAWLVGSKDGRQLCKGLGDLTAAAAKTDVTQVAFFCRQLLQHGDYLGAVALAGSFRAAYPKSVAAQFTEAALERSAVASHLAADGRYGVPARAAIDALSKANPQLFAVQQAELEIAQERSDSEQVLTLARGLTAKFADLPLSHYLLAEVYRDRKWEPEAETQIDDYLNLYSLGGADAGQNAYRSSVPGPAHQFAADFHQHHGRQSTYLQLLSETHQAGQDTTLQWALHLQDIGQADDGLKLLQNDLETWPVYKRRITWEIARFQKQQGNLEAFRSALDARIERNPYDSDLLGSRIHLSVRQGLTKEALADIATYLGRFGEDESLLRLQADLEHRDPLAWYKPYAVAIDAVPVADYTTDKYKSASTADLIDLQVVRVFPDTTAWVYHKSVIVPLVTDAVDQVSHQQIGALKDALTVSSLNPNGDSYVPDYINGNTAEMYNVQVGTRVSTENVEFHPANEDQPSLQWNEQFRTVDDPTGLRRLVMILPKDLDAKLHIFENLPDDIKHTRTVQGDEIIHVFENTTHAPLHQEDAMPMQDLMARLTLYSDPTDLYHGTDLSLTVTPGYPSQLVRETAETILKPLPADATRLQKFDAILQWVKTALRPGEGAATFDDMIAMKVAGNHPTRQELAQALAISVGLPVRAVMQVATYNPYRDILAKVRRFVYPQGELLQVGDAGMLALEDPNGDLHYRTVMGQQAQLYPSVPSVDPSLNDGTPLCNYVALATPMGETLRRFQGVHQSGAGLSLEMAVQVGADNTAALTGRAFVYGPSAGQVREQRTDARNREILDDRIAQWFWPQLASRQLSYFDAGAPEAPLEIAAAGTIGRIGQTDAVGPQDGIAIPALRAPGRGSLSSILGLMGKTDRDYDFLLDQHLDSTQAYFMPQAIVYEAPAGWGWSSVPEDLILDTEFGWYYCDYQVLGRRLEVHRGFVVPKQDLTPEQWKRFNAFLGAIRNYELLGTIVCQPLPADAPFHTPVLSRGAVRTDLSW
ncbi:MAG: tetratricopeptide repeat protein, partial [Planctomycetota bacterium]